MWNPLSLARAIIALPAFMEQTMSALEDLKAAVAKNDAGIAHVSDLLKEYSDRLAANPDEISGDEIEEIAQHLSAAADTLSGFTLVAPQTSGVAGATTANQAPPANPEPQPEGPPTPPVDGVGVVS